MKQIVFFFTLALIVGCSNDIQSFKYSELRKQDSTRITSKANLILDSLKKDNAKLKDSLNNISCKKVLAERDSLLILTDTLSNKLFISNYKVERVRYYLNICLRDKSQDVFLKGWLVRAIK